jgi:hypothetical protein
MQGPADSGASVYARAKRGNSLGVKCHFTTLDQLLSIFKLPKRAKLDVIIIDVEGAEIEVLEGANDTLNSMKTWVLIEFHPKVKTQIVQEGVDKLTRYGYKNAIFSVGPAGGTVTYLFWKDP